MNIGNKIENLTPIIETPTLPKAAPADASVQSEAQNTDKAQLSTAANQLAQSASGSDVRLDKVASIQSALRAGTYSVPASAVAQKVVSSLLTSDK